MKGFLVVPIIQIFRRLQNQYGITSQRNHIFLSDTLYECMKILIFPLIVQIGFELWLVIYSFGIPRWHSDKESTYQCRRYKRCRFSSWVGETPWSKVMATLSSMLAWKIPGQRSLVGYSPWGHRRAGHDRATEHTCTQTQLFLQMLYSYMLK